MDAESALTQIKSRLTGIVDEDLTTAEQQIKRIIDGYFKCTCKPSSKIVSRSCKADVHN